MGTRFLVTFDPQRETMQTGTPLLPDSNGELLQTPTLRRSFLRTATLSVVGAGALAACGKAAASTPEATAAAETPRTAPVAAPLSPRAAADAMDAMHEKGMKASPAKTAGLGNQLMTPRMVNGVKVFELTAQEIKWEVTPGQTVAAMAYNGQVPGPQIRVREGDRVRVILKNELTQSSAIHFHGVELPNSAMQVGLGLLGAFIIEPKSPREIENVDKDYVLILNDGMHGFTINGEGFPATQPFTAKLGEKIRIRYMNEGMMIHPVHLHGMHMTVIDKDGWAQPQPWRCDTLNIAPGERWDVIINCNNPGTWAFHCHILAHAESDHGMFGMVTALVVEK